MHYSLSHVHQSIYMKVIRGLFILTNIIMPKQTTNTPYNQIRVKLIFEDESSMIQRTAIR